MRKIVLLFTLVFGLQFSVFAQNANNSPEAVIRSFYTQYFKLKPGVKSDMRKSVSAGLLKRVEKLSKNADGDYYTQSSGDMDIATMKIISISKPVVSKSKAVSTVKISYKYGDETPDFELKVTLIKEKGLWKIDGVEPL